MKNNFTLTIAVLGFCTSALAQVPEGFNYQALVRDDNGIAIADQSVGYRFNILQGSSTGTSVYMEEHTTTTDARGLVNLVIGDGTSSGDLGSVNWSNGPYYLEVAIDENGGTNYVTLGTSPLQSVPFAMHARTVENTDDADADPTNELQDLSITGNSLSISNGNTITIDGDPSNELQDLSISGNSLSISNGNTVTVDGDPSNELQTLSISGNSLTISQGNTVDLPTGSAPAPESLAKAWVNFPITGTPNLAFDGYNVTATSVVGTGIRTVTLAPGLFSVATNPAIVCQIRNDLAPGFCTVISSTSPSQVTVRTFNAAGTLTDKEFSLVIFGK